MFFKLTFELRQGKGTLMAPGMVSFSKLGGLQGSGVFIRHHAKIVIFPKSV
jgi:hypothetical protein